MDYIIKETNQLKENGIWGEKYTHHTDKMWPELQHLSLWQLHITIPWAASTMRSALQAERFWRANLPDDLSHGPSVLEQKFKGELGFSPILFKILSKVDQNKDKSLKRNHKRNVKHFIMFGLTRFKWLVLLQLKKRKMLLGLGAWEQREKVLAEDKGPWSEIPCTPLSLLVC